MGVETRFQYNVVFCVSVKRASVPHLCPTDLWTEVSEVHGHSGPSQEML